METLFYVDNFNDVTNSADTVETWTLLLFRVFDKGNRKM